MARPLWLAITAVLSLQPQFAVLQAQSDPDPAAPCQVRQIVRVSEGLRIWSPSGEQYLQNTKDAAGIYQIYVGNSGDSAPTCISCTARPNSPLVSRHKLQAHWHPSGRWIVLAGEWDDIPKPFFATPDLIEGWVQSGIWVDIYAVRPDGSEWYRLSDFAHQRGDGFTGVAFTPDGNRAVWAQIIGSPGLQLPFGDWELILSDFVEDDNGIPAFTHATNITPQGAHWIEPGNFAPDGVSLLITADIGLSDSQGMDQFILNTQTGKVLNLTDSPNVWDEHGVFSPDGQKILFMSSYPFQADRFSNQVLFLKTEFMMMNKDGSGLQQLTHFNVAGFPESNTKPVTSVAAVGGWVSGADSISVLNLFFPNYETWTIMFDPGCGTAVRKVETHTLTSKDKQKQ